MWVHLMVMCGQIAFAHYGGSDLLERIVMESQGDDKLEKCRCISLRNMTGEYVREMNFSFQFIYSHNM